MTQIALGGLIGDIGGTNIRLALIDGDGDTVAEQVLRCADFTGPVPAIRHYLSQIGAAPRRAAFAVAAPIASDRIEMTNNDWCFSVAAVKSQMQWDSLGIVNDFQAVALSIPHLAPTDLIVVGGGRAMPDAPVGVLGPGTGLGVSGLIPNTDGFTSLATEGGHVTFSPRGHREAALALWLESEYGHVSAERVISGPGLVNLHRAIAALEGRTHLHDEPDSISSGAMNGTCPICIEAIDHFFAMFGTIAGNLALSLGARGGIVIAGGIIPRLLPLFESSRFRQRFEDKGRFTAYLADIQTAVLMHPYPAFLGLAGLLRR
jgi:glucokinase